MVSPEPASANEIGIPLNIDKSLIIYQRFYLGTSNQAGTLSWMAWTKTQALSRGGWQFWIDRGGTFTDIVGRSSDGDLLTHSCYPRTPRPMRRRSSGDL